MTKWSACLAGALWLLGCGGGGGTPDTGSSDSGNSDASDGSSALPGEAYCASVNASTPACPVATGGVRSCGVCVSPPLGGMGDQLVRTSCAQLPMRQEYCDSASPAAAVNLTCYTSFDPAHPPTAPTPQTVTLWGVVDVFGTGGDSDMIQIQVFEVNVGDGSLGAMVASTTATTATCPASFANCQEVVTDTSGMVTQRRNLGAFVIPNLQTEHPYVVRTQGPMDLFGHALYDYSVPIRNTAVGMMTPPAAFGGAAGVTGPSVFARLRTISNSDWATVPSTAGLPTGIPSGTAAVAGEVHDCDDVRLSNATVYSTPAPNYAPTVYFSNNPTQPLPDSTRSPVGTGLLGLWALLNVSPGSLRVSAVGYDSTNTLVHAGSYVVHAFPDSVTVVSLRGLRPWQYSH